MDKWGPYLVKIACTSTSVAHEKAVEVLRKIIHADVSSVRSAFLEGGNSKPPSKDFADISSDNEDKPHEEDTMTMEKSSTGLSWCTIVWDALLGPGGGIVEYNIPRLPTPIHISIFCTHFELALLDSEAFLHAEGVSEQAASTLETYRSMIGRYIQKVEGHLPPNFWANPNVVYALISYLLTPSRPVRQSIQSLIAKYVFIISQHSIPTNISHHRPSMIDACYEIGSRHIVAFVESISDILGDVYIIGIDK